MGQGFFAPLQTDEWKALLSSLISGTISAAALALGGGPIGLVPYLRGAEGPLKIVMNRSVDMWTDRRNRPSMALTVAGRQAEVDYGAYGVRLDATAVMEGSRRTRTLEGTVT